MVQQLRDLDDDHDDDNDSFDDYDYDHDGNFTLEDVFEVMKITGKQVGNSTHKKLDIWAVVQYFQNQPAIREEESRVFNANGEIQFPVGTLTASGMTDAIVDKCVILTNKLISVNDSDPSCAPLVNITTNLTITKLVNYSATIPAIMKNGKVCSLFDECSGIRYNASGDSIKFGTNSFSNYSAADLSFVLDGAPGNNKNEVKANKVHPKNESGTNLTGAGYSTCVIDSGVNYNHSQFDNYLGGYDYCASNDCVGVDNDPFDLNGHGTSVSGIIFSRDYGIAPDAGIVSVKVADENGDVSANAILGAIDWCINKSSVYNISAIVISISDGGSYNSSNCPAYFQESVNEAESLGILVVASVGNGANANAISYPSCEPVVVSVGATKEDSVNFTNFTNNGQDVKIRNLFAPGENITTTNLTAGLSVFQGTSLSAPHIAAAKILIDQYIDLSNHSAESYDMDNDADWDNDDVYALLNISGYRVGNGNNVKLDVWAAINYIRGRYTGEPAIRPEENRMFNSEGSIKYIPAVLSANASLENVVETCVRVSNNFIDVNDELSQCSQLRDVQATLSMGNLPEYNETPTIFRDGSICSLFFCPNQDYNLTTRTITFGVLSFSNYTTNGTVFNFSVDAPEEANMTLATSIVPHSVAAGSNVVLSFNVTASDYSVSAKWINLTYPNGTRVRLNSVPYVFGNTFSTGRYNVTFWANDSRGNWSNSSDYFEVFSPVNFNFNVFNSANSGVNSSFEMYYRNQLVNSNLSATGSHFKISPDASLVLKIKAYFNRLSVTLRDFDVGSEDGKSLGLDRHNAISNYLVTYGIATSNYFVVQAFGDPFSFSNATVRIYYDDLTFNNENNLELYKCDNYDFSGKTCLGNWANVTNLATQELASNYFEYEIVSMSDIGFSIKEYMDPVVVVIPPVVDGGGSGGGGGGGASGGVAGGVPSITGKVVEGGEKTVKGESPIKKELFDIAWKIEDRTIKNFKELIGIATFSNFGEALSSVNLTFTILDEAGNVIYTAKEVVSVATEKSVEWKFAERGLQELPYGRYKAVLETLYNVDVYDKFEQEFEIRKENVIIAYIKDNWIFGVGVVLLILLIVFLYKKIKHGKWNF